MADSTGPSGPGYCRPQPCPNGAADTCGDSGSPISHFAYSPPTIKVLCDLPDMARRHADRAGMLAEVAELLGDERGAEVWRTRQGCHLAIALAAETEQ